MSENERDGWALMATITRRAFSVDSAEVADITHSDSELLNEIDRHGLSISGSEPPYQRWQITRRTDTHPGGELLADVIGVDVRQALRKAIARIRARGAAT